MKLKTVYLICSEKLKENLKYCLTSKISVIKLKRKVDSKQIMCMSV